MRRKSMTRLRWVARDLARALRVVEEMERALRHVKAAPGLRSEAHTLADRLHDTADRLAEVGTPRTPGGAPCEA